MGHWRNLPAGTTWGVWSDVYVDGYAYFEPAGTALTGTHGSFKATFALWPSATGHFIQGGISFYNDGGWYTGQTSDPIGDVYCML